MIIINLLQTVSFHPQLLPKHLPVNNMFQFTNQFFCATNLHTFYLLEVCSRSIYSGQTCSRSTCTGNKGLIFLPWLIFKYYHSHFVSSNYQCNQRVTFLSATAHYSCPSMGRVTQILNQTLFCSLCVLYALVRQLVRFIETEYLYSCLCICGYIVTLWVTILSYLFTIH